MTDRTTQYVCQGCGDARSELLPTCPACGGSYQLHEFIRVSDSISFDEREELVGQERDEDRHAIEFKSFDGMRAHSTLDASTVELILTGPIDIGRRSDGLVADRVISQLRADGHTVALLPHDDSGGEDRKVRCDDAALTIQVVGVPAATEFLAEASRSSATTVVPIAQAADWVCQAVAKRANKYSAIDKACTILAVDARAVGVLVSAPVVSALESSADGNLCGASGFGAIWLVGPLDSLCTRLPSSRW